MKFFSSLGYYIEECKNNIVDLGYLYKITLTFKSGALLYKIQWIAKKGDKK